MLNGERCPLDEHAERELHDGDELYCSPRSPAGDEPSPSPSPSPIRPTPTRDSDSALVGPSCSAIAGVLRDRSRLRQDTRRACGWRAEHDLPLASARHGPGARSRFRERTHHGFRRIRRFDLAASLSRPAIRPPRFRRPQARGSSAARRDEHRAQHPGGESALRSRPAHHFFFSPGTPSSSVPRSVAVAYRYLDQLDAADARAFLDRVRAMTYLLAR